jgi:hypothetical protein
MNSAAPTSNTAWLRAERKDEKKERGFHKLPQCTLLNLNTSAKPPFTKAAEHPTKFYESILAEKSAFKVKQLVNHEFSSTNVKHSMTQSRKKRWKERKGIS